MRLAIFSLIFLGWCVAGLLRPAYASGLLIWVDIFSPLELAFAVGAYPMSLISLFVMVASFLGHLVAKGFKPNIGFFFWMWIAFIGWAGLCTVISPFPMASNDGMIRILKYLGPLLIVSLSAKTVKEVRFLIYVMVFSIGVWGMQVGIGCLKNGVNNNMHIPGTQIGDNNFFSAAIVSILPVLVYIISSYTGRFRLLAKAGFLLCLLLCLATVVFSNSRGAAMGVVGNIVIYLVFISNRKVRDISIALALGGVIAMLLPQSFYDRMSTLKDVGSEQAESSAKERMLLIKSTSRAIQDYPVFGVGPYSWVMVSSSYTGLEIAMQPHNIWLKCAVELGYPGVALFAVLVFGTIYRLLALRKRALALRDGKTANLSLALATSLLSYTISLTFLSNYDLEFHWAWMAVSNAAVEVLTRAMNAPRRKPVPSPASPPAAPRQEQPRQEQGT